MTFRNTWVIFAFLAAALAQDAKLPPTDTTPSSPEKKEAMQVLEDSLEQSARLAAPTRAWLQISIAKAFDSDTKKELDVLERAFRTTLEIDTSSLDGRKSRYRYQQASLSRIQALDKETYDRLLPYSEAAIRKAMLAKEFQAKLYKDKDPDAAWAIMDELIAQNMLDGHLAHDVLGSHAADQNRKNIVFAALLKSEKARDKKDGQLAGFDDLPTLLRAYGKELSRTLVNDALDMIVSSSESDKDETAMLVHFDKAHLTFQGQQEFRLFQVIGVLQELDPSGAKDLLSKYPRVKELYEANPDPGQASDITYSSNKSSAQLANDKVNADHTDEMLTRIRTAYNENCDKALEIAAAQPAPANSPLSPRAMAYTAVVGMARNSPTHGCLDKAVDGLLDSIKNTRPMSQPMHIAAAFRAYRTVKDEAGMIRVAEKGLELSNTLLKEDTDMDDPNKADKELWPSFVVANFCMQKLRKDKPELANAYMAKITDPDFFLLHRAALALADVGKSPELMQMRVDGKHKGFSGTFY
jgi:hypothetical protein